MRKIVLQSPLVGTCGPTKNDRSKGRFVIRNAINGALDAEKGPDRSRVPFPDLSSCGYWTITVRVPSTVDFLAPGALVSTFTTPVPLALAVMTQVVVPGAPMRPLVGAT
jgi:hypothetical protein